MKKLIKIAAYAVPAYAYAIYSCNAEIIGIALAGHYGLLAIAEAI